VTERFRREEVVAPSVPDAVARFVEQRVGPAEVEPLSGDASTRRYFRVRAASDSWVVALYPEPFDPAELSFCVVRELFAAYGLPVPEIRDHDGGGGLLLLEDLGEHTLQAALEAADARATAEFYREALEQLALLQGASARGPQKAACFHVAFDIEKLSWELHYFEKHFLEGLRGADPSVEDRATLAEGFLRLAQEIASWPRVLCHRDFHSRNLMPHRERLYWIDFQDARMGPASYDLASLLRDSYIGLDEEFVAARAEEFRQRAVPGEPREVFQRRFELMSLQRNLKALGTFGFMATQRHNLVYIPYIPGTLASARRNLLRHPELGGLRRVLARHVEELA
jgi:aminoglycoside/choline kinase family phosphotransferase